MRFPDRIEIVLPNWVDSFLARPPDVTTPAARMAFVLRMASLNQQRGTGGPFAAAVFDARSSDLVAVGVNAVVPAIQSIAHAEVLALSLAQRAIGSHDLGRGGVAYELVTSVEPCAMCLGAVCWSGVRSVVCGARGEDAEAIGFDEGPKPADWVAALEQRQITVTRDLLRDQAVAILQSYRTSGGPIY